MANTFLVSGHASGNTTSGGGTTTWWTPGACINSKWTGEAAGSIVIRSAGTLSRLSIYLGGNANSSGSTWRLRKNTANGNGVVSIGAGATGWFEDTSNSDTIAAGDKIAAQLTDGTGSGQTVTQIALTYSATTDTVSRFVGNLNSAVLSGTQYWTVLNSGSSTSAATSAAADAPVRKAGTAKNLQINVLTNAASGATTLTTFLNDAASALTISVAAGASGTFEDTTNSVSLAVGDKLSNRTVAGSGTFQVTNAALDYVTTTGHGTIGNSDQGGNTLAPGSTFTTLSGATAYNGTEAVCQLKFRDSYTLLDLTSVITANSTTAGSTVQLRKNGTNVTNVVSIGAGATGIFTDTTHTDSIVGLDLVCTQLTVGGGGSLSFTDISLNTLAVVVTIPLTVYVQWEEM